MRRTVLPLFASSSSIYCGISVIITLLLHSYNGRHHPQQYDSAHLFNLHSLLKSSQSYRDNSVHFDFAHDHSYNLKDEYRNELFQNISMSGLYTLKTGNLKDCCDGTRDESSFYAFQGPLS